MTDLEGLLDELFDEEVEPAVYKMAVEGYVKMCINTNEPTLKVLELLIMSYFAPLHRFEDTVQRLSLFFYIYPRSRRVVVNPILVEAIANTLCEVTCVQTKWSDNTVLQPSQIIGHVLDWLKDNEGR